MLPYYQGVGTLPVSISMKFEIVWKSLQSQVVGDIEETRERRVVRKDVCTKAEGVDR